jgi:hypothetical protein
MFNQFEIIPEPSAPQVRESMEIDVPLEGAYIAFEDGRFQKFFSVQPSTQKGVAAVVMTDGLKGFRVALCKAVPKRVMPDGTLRWHDPEFPVEGRVHLTITGE